jgi:hypothetical protein
MQGLITGWTFYVFITFGAICFIGGYFAGSKAHLRSKLISTKLDSIKEKLDKITKD